MGEKSKKKKNNKNSKGKTFEHELGIKRTACINRMHIAASSMNVFVPSTNSDSSRVSIDISGDLEETSNTIWYAIINSLIICKTKHKTCRYEDERRCLHDCLIQQFHKTKKLNKIQTNKKECFAYLTVSSKGSRSDQTTKETPPTEGERSPLRPNNFIQGSPGGIA